MDFSDYGNNFLFVLIISYYRPFSYPSSGDRNLILSLAFDAMVTEWFPGNITGASNDEKGYVARDSSYYQHYLDDFLKQIFWFAMRLDFFSPMRLPRV